MSWAHFTGMSLQEKIHAGQLLMSTLPPTERGMAVFLSLHVLEHCEANNGEPKMTNIVTSEGFTSCKIVTSYVLRPSKVRKT